MGLAEQRATGFRGREGSVLFTGEWSVHPGLEPRLQQVVGVDGGRWARSLRRSRSHAAKSEGSLTRTHTISPNRMEIGKTSAALAEQTTTHSAIRMAPTDAPTTSVRQCVSAEFRGDQQDKRLVMGMGVSTAVGIVALMEGKRGLRGRGQVRGGDEVLR